MARPDERVLRRIEEWKQKLIDPSKRNRLLNFHIGAKGTVRLEEPSVETLYKRLVISNKSFVFYHQNPLDLPFSFDDDDDGATPPARSLKQNEVRTNLSDRQLVRTLYGLRQRARTSLQEQGVVTLFVAMGILEWVDRAGANFTSPLLLIPVDLQREVSDETYRLSLFEEDVVLNPALAYRLAPEQIRFPELPKLDSLRPQDYFLEVSKVVQPRGWWVQEDAYLGLFSFLKITMYEDLSEHIGQAVKHPLVRALAGDTQSLVIPHLPDPANLDGVAIEDTFQILDADSSQQEAIQAAKCGVSFVLQGPPGTGKSQTIANIIAECLAQGKKVLFVSEKMAALEVVYRRLMDNRLGDFCLQAHSHKANKRQVIEELGRALNAKIGTTAPPALELAALAGTRTGLNEYIDSLHTARGGLELTAFQVYGRLATLAEAADLNFAVADVLGTSPDRLAAINEVLARLTQLHDVALTHASHPWRNTRLRQASFQVEREISERFARLREILTRLETSARAFAATCDLDAPRTREDINRLAEVAVLLQSTPKPPPQWLQAKSLAPLMKEVRGLKSACDAHLARRAALLSRFDQRLLQANLPELDARLSTTHQAVLQQLAARGREPGDALVAAREELQRALSALVNVIGQMSQTAAALAQACGVPVPNTMEGAARVRALADLIIEYAHGNAVPAAHWLRLASVEPLVEEVRRLKAHCDEYLARHATLFASFKHKLSQANLVSLEAHLTSAHGALFQRLVGPSRTADAALALRPKLVPTLTHIVHLLKQVSASAATLASGCGVPTPDSLAGAVNLCSLADLVIQDPRPERHWFARGELVRLRAAAEEAQRQCATYQQGRNALKERYDDSFLSLDHSALVERFSNQYSSALRFVQPSYHRDMRSIRAIRLRPDELSPSDLLADLRVGKATADSKRWIESQQADHLRDFGRHYNGVETSWGVVAQALECCRQIIEWMPGGVVPTVVVDVLVRSGPAIEQISGQRVALGNVLAELRTRLGNLRQMLVLEPLPFTSRELRDANISSLQTWFTELQDHLSGFLTAYDTAAGFQETVRGAESVTVLVSAIREARALLQADINLNNAVPRFRQTYGDLFTGFTTDWHRVFTALDWTGRVLAWFRPGGVTEGFLRAYASATETVWEQRRILNSQITECEAQLGILRKLLVIEALPGSTSDLAGTDFLSLREGFADLERHVAYFLTAYDTVEGYRVTREGAASVAELVGAIREARDLNDEEAAFGAKDERLRQNFGDFFTGLHTNWERVLAAVGWTDDVLTWFGPCGVSNGFVRLACETHGLAGVGRSIEELRTLQVRVGEEWGYVRQVFDTAKCDVNGEPLEQVSINSLRTWLQIREGQLSHLSRWLSFQRATEQANGIGLGDFITAVLRNPPPADQIRHSFFKRFWMMWLDAAHQECPTLAGFDGRVQDALVESFCTLDRVQITNARGRLRARLAAHKPTLAWRNSANGELAVLQREIGKRMRHKPLRQLFAQAPHVIQSLKPCMLMSPLSVAQFLDPECLTFDVVLFDEASQICSEDAVGAIMRAQQVIIVGDDRQLPPTRFFAAGTSEMDGDDDSEDATGDVYESILEEYSTVGLPQRKLLWHYRSRNEDLITFSNRRYYNGDLITFPEPRVPGDVQASQALSFVYVSNGMYVRGGSGAGRPKDAGTNRIEARRLAELVLEHFRQHPDESLGVIAFSEAQQRAIDQELLTLRHTSRQYERFFDEDKPEAFFVKNLENVQGDERDCIIFSVGYGRDSSGSLSMNFGPLNKKGGERRLNVAVTRARYRVTLVSSIQPTEIDLSRTEAQGVKDLRGYMEFAKEGTLLQPAGQKEADELADDLLAGEICRVLETAGIEAHRDIGCSESRVDIAIVDDENPGRYILGILCDGSTSTASKTARDRYRLRQEVLESRGWNVIRLWSSDWVRRREQEVDRILDAVIRARTMPREGASEPSDEWGTSESELPSGDEPDEGGADDAATDRLVEDVHPGRESLPIYRPLAVPALGQQHDFYWAAENDCSSIVALLIQVVEQEGPVHLLEATRRVVSAWGMSKAGSRLVGIVQRCVDSAERHESIRVQGDFLWPHPKSDVQARVPAPRDEPRHIELIALEEIGAAALHCIRESFGIERSALITSTARLLGYDRTGAKVRDRISNAIDLLVKQERVRERGVNLTLADVDLHLPLNP